MNSNTSAAYPPAWRRALAGVCGLVFSLATSAAAQYPAPGNPVPTVPVVPGGSSTALVGIGSVAPIGTTGFRLTFPAPWQRGAVWTVNKQLIAGGFQSTFQFRISNIGG